ncbi:MAG: DUF4861 family protein [Paludibacteraceae bacterium]|nr:DUF4861 family protein [Paludibacteraceae bacterium]
MKRSNRRFIAGLTVAIATILQGCAPRVATSFWRIGTPDDSTRAGYAILHEGKKVRHCYPVTEWTDTANSQRPTANGKNDTYHSFHHHGVAVESELMAYRIYFDKKQTIDIYCKRTPRMELATSYWYPNDSLLALDYGDDILRVSGTVGLGSVKYWNGKKHVHIEPVAERSERIVRRSRNKATVEVAVKDWQTEGKSVDMSVQYTLCAGHRDMRCDVTLSEPVNGLCTGVQSIPATNATVEYLTGEADLSTKWSVSEAVRQHSYWLCDQLTNGVLLASWGTDWPVNDTVKYAKETVGLAVFIPKEYAGELVQDKSNNLCLLHLTGSKRAGLTENRSDSAAVQQPDGRFYRCHFYLTCIGATKEIHPVATNADEWLAYLRRWAAQLK